MQAADNDVSCCYCYYSNNSNNNNYYCHYYYYYYSYSYYYYYCYYCCCCCYYYYYYYDYDYDYDYDDLYVYVYVYVYVTVAFRRCDCLHFTQQKLGFGAMFEQSPPENFLLDPLAQHFWSELFVRFIVRSGLYSTLFENNTFFEVGFALLFLILHRPISPRFSSVFQGLRSSDLNFTQGIVSSLILLGANANGVDI